MLSVSRFTLTKVRLFVLSPSSHQLSPRKTPTKPSLSCPQDGRTLSPPTHPVIESEIIHLRPNAKTFFSRVPIAKTKVKTKVKGVCRLPRSRRTGGERPPPLA